MAATARTGAALCLHCWAGQWRDELLSGQFASFMAGSLNVTSQTARWSDTTDFAESDRLWLSMGYNMSDSHAQWLQAVEMPEMEEALQNGREMIKSMQTSHVAVDVGKAATEDIQLELEATWQPKVPSDLTNTLETLACSKEDAVFEPLGFVSRYLMTEEGHISACQSCCARLVGCVLYSFWRPGRHCHVLGSDWAEAGSSPSHGPSFAKLSGLLEHLGELWVSGAPGCREGQICPATLLLAERLSRDGRPTHPRRSEADSAAICSKWKCVPSKWKTDPSTKKWSRFSCHLQQVEVCAQQAEDRHVHEEVEPIQLPSAASGRPTRPRRSGANSVVICIKWKTDPSTKKWIRFSCHLQQVEVCTQQVEDRPIHKEVEPIQLSSAATGRSTSPRRSGADSAAICSKWKTDPSTKKWSRFSCHLQQDSAVASKWKGVPTSPTRPSLALANWRVLFFESCSQLSTSWLDHAAAARASAPAA
ncbi:unnamed protein product [Polarella glacialis]|uniref:Uncharacterized protein n=1 Tax=Polarella glacialis TaxID=89957 RepID=A0A813F6K3_POLGL|nr:unnamed protein product [Polarella glacialis]